MESCRLNDPSTLAAWLDGVLEPPNVREIDEHLLGGCPICWSVLRFVGRLRELVGDRAAPCGGAGGGTATVLLDSEIMRLAMGLPRHGGLRREMLLEAGPFDAVVRIEDGPSTSAGVLQLFVVHRETRVPPAESLEVEVRRGAELIARADTNRYGQAVFPVPCDNATGLHLVLRGPGIRSTTISLA
jgi:hypothetical protein